MPPSELNFSGAAASGSLRFVPLPACGAANGCTTTLNRSRSGCHVSLIGQRSQSLFSRRRRGGRRVGVHDIARRHAGRGVPQHGDRRLFLRPKLLDPFRLIQHDADHRQNRRAASFEAADRRAIAAPPPGDEAEPGHDQPGDHGGGDRPRRGQKRERSLGVHGASPVCRRGRGRHRPASATIATSIAPTHIRQISRASDFMLPASIVDAVEIEPAEQLGDAAVAQDRRAIFRRGAIDGQDLLVGRVDAGVKRVFGRKRVARRPPVVARRRSISETRRPPQAAARCRALPHPPRAPAGWRRRAQRRSWPATSRAADGVVAQK